ncbi:hypothetical protein [Evansella clarkii]|uniref:hypothetical protein n=1 Tax=Evansella clarkii TaxID=79879 RepID=UPI00099714E0|nr:hypothetical protein [Evansella clarkii]
MNRYNKTIDFIDIVMVIQYTKGTLAVLQEGFAGQLLIMTFFNIQNHRAGRSLSPGKQHLRRSIRS